MSLFKNTRLGCVALFGIACGSTGRTTVPLSWRVVQQGKANVVYPGIEGAKVCVEAQPAISCAMTDAQGNFTLNDLPASAEIVLTIEKDGFIPSLKPIETAGPPNLATQDIATVVPQPIVMFQAADLPTNLGFDIDTKDSGIIDFFVLVFQGANQSNPSPLAGVKVALSPTTQTGAVYFSEPGVFDPALQATASFGGTVGLGNLTSGHFFNVPPGDYKVTFTGPAGYTCATLTSPVPAWGFPVPGQSAVRVPVRAGHNTANIGMHCQP
jgi:hypothetical protein